MNPLRNTIILTAMLSFILIGCEEKVTKKVTHNHFNTEGTATGGGITENDSSEGGGGGVINGGGGKGVLCEASNGEKTLELLDLYEGRTLFERTIKPVPDSREEAIEAFSVLMAKHAQTPGHHEIDQLAKAMRKFHIDPFFEKFKFLGDGQNLRVTDDSFEPVLEKGCELVQIGVYYDESVLLIDQSLWDMMDWTNKIAFVAHEIYYKRARERGATDSMGARKLVGKMFSEKGVKGLGDGLPRDRGKVVTCDLKKDGVFFGQFDMVETQTEYSDHAIEVVFQNLNEVNMMFRTSAILEDINFVHLAYGLKSKRTSALIVDSYHQGMSQFVKMDFDRRGETGDLSGSITTYSGATNGVEDEFQFHCHHPSTLWDITNRESKSDFYIADKHSDTPNVLRVFDNGIIHVTGQWAISEDYRDLPKHLSCETTTVGFIIEQSDSDLQYQVLDFSGRLYYINTDPTDQEFYFHTNRREDCLSYKKRKRQEAIDGTVRYSYDLSIYEKVDRSELPPQFREDDAWKGFETLDGDVNDFSYITE